MLKLINFNFVFKYQNFYLIIFLYKNAIIIFLFTVVLYKCFIYIINNNYLKFYLTISYYIQFSILYLNFYYEIPL